VIRTPGLPIIIKSWVIKKNAACIAKGVGTRIGLLMRGYLFKDGRAFDLMQMRSPRFIAIGHYICSLNKKFSSFYRDHP
jgi:hypothetical protein